MSDAPRRMTYDQATKLAARLWEVWQLKDTGAAFVGSIRRRRPAIGDLELVAPVPATGGRDALFEIVAATMQPESSSLFGGGTATKTIGRAIRGLKPGFLATSLELNALGRAIAVQIYRYTPDNLGWLMIERTGPTEFGRYFLTRWKKAWGIPLGAGEQPASVNNHLVDAAGKVIAVPTEADAFRLAATPFVPPERRDEVIASMGFGELLR